MLMDSQDNAVSGLDIFMRKKQSQTYNKAQIWGYAKSWRWGMIFPLYKINSGNESGHDY